MFLRRPLSFLVSKLMTLLQSLASKLMTTEDDATAASSTIAYDMDKIWLGIQEIDADDILPEDSISNCDCEDECRTLADIDDISPEDSISNAAKPSFDPTAEQSTLATQDDANSDDDAKFEGGSAELDDSDEDMSDVWQLLRGRHFGGRWHQIESAGCL
eukprot:TRINITY_DN8071_c0_g2_i1.p1 TRINITY_DN8071_c0_g2~~TRINITY_DN8071_c0_g2_i1.p1  ORF type:complete len:159 (+),score=35.97 TRINITY_DN8071_c0_g2_i1:72-548(+)